MGRQLSRLGTTGQVDGFSRTGPGLGWCWLVTGRPLPPAILPASTRDQSVDSDQS